MIERPTVDFDAIAHKYTLENGEPLAGVSSVAKIGGAEDSFNIASAWGFRLGYEGAWDVAADHFGGNADWPESKDDLRAELMSRRQTPWAKRDDAGVRGTLVHDGLEQLGQKGQVWLPDDYSEEECAHLRSLYRMYLALRPEFVALEVQIVSAKHGFAGRYDVRALVDARRLLPAIDPPGRPELIGVRNDQQAERIRELAADGKKALGLLDLKTSKGIYPETHFPQLEGYEGAGVEMGFPATDFRAVINTSVDESFSVEKNVGVSWATYDNFLGLLGAFRAIKYMKSGDPELMLEEKRMAVLRENLPARSSHLAGLDIPALWGMDSRAIGRLLGKMRKRGQVEQQGRGVWALVGA